ncbi:MAG: hypothetical protein ACXACP_04235 [Candidatus Hodarchaeales archaeon]
MVAAEAIINKEKKIILTSKLGIGIILTFGLALLLVSTLFIMSGTLVMQITREVLIPINIITISALLFGAIVVTYYYHTRYVRRKLIITPEGCTLSVGTRLFEYKWSEFSIVALSVSYSTYGPKGYIIKLFEDDLEGEYIDLPIYRFSKSIDIFDLRSYIEKKVRSQKIN